MALVDLEPNQPVPEHQHENEQMGFVVRGQMEMRVGDDNRRLAVGETLQHPQLTPCTRSSRPGQTDAS